MSISTRRYTRTYVTGGQPDINVKVTFELDIPVTDGVSITAAPTPIVGYSNSEGILIGPDSGTGIEAEVLDEGTTVPAGTSYIVTEDFGDHLYKWRMVASIMDPNPCDLALKVSAVPAELLYPELTPTEAAALVAAATLIGEEAAAAAASASAAAGSASAAAGSASAAAGDVTAAAASATAAAGSAAAAVTTVAGVPPLVAAEATARTNADSAHVAAHDPHGDRTYTIVSVQTASYSALLTDEVLAFHITAAATITLPAPGNLGKTYLLSNLLSSTANLTIALTSGTLDGATTVLPGQGVEVVDDGTEWRQVSGPSLDTSPTAGAVAGVVSGTAFIPNATHDCDVYFNLTGVDPWTLTIGPSTGTEEPLGNGYGQYGAPHCKVPKGWKVILTYTGVFTNVTQIPAH